MSPYIPVFYSSETNQNNSIKFGSYYVTYTEICRVYFILACTDSIQHMQLKSNFQIKLLVK
jgi:hypothetical protein